MKQLLFTSALLLSSLSGINAQIFTQNPVATAVCSGTGAAFSVTSPGASSYQWQIASGTVWSDLVDGGVYSGATTSQLSISDATGLDGTQYRCFVMDSLMAADTSSAAVLTVHNLPVATINPVLTAIFCQGDSLVLSAVTGNDYAYQWMNGSNPISGANAAIYTAAASGNYILHVTDSNNCSANSTVMPVTVNALPAVSVSSSGPTSFCAGGSVNLVAAPLDSTASYSYQWLEGSQLIISATSALATFTASGDYQVVVTDYTTGCSSISPIVSIQSNALPTTALSLSGQPVICSGGTVGINAPIVSSYTYQWSESGLPLSGATSATLSAGAAGRYQVTVTDGATGCSDTSASVLVTVNPSPIATANANGPVTVCQGNTVSLSANAGTQLQYQWMNNGADIPNENNIGFAANTSGDYSVRVTNEFGCSVVSVPVTVAVNALPVAAITYDAPLAFCEGGAVVLTADTSSGGLTYQWLVNGAPDPSNTNSYMTVSAAGTYSVLVSNGYNCSSVSSTISVIVFPKPQPVIAQSANYLTTGSFATYQWFRNNQAIGGANSFDYTATANGGYRVDVTDVNGCVNSSQTVILNSLAINEIAGSTVSVRVYPTPTTGIVHVEASEKVNVVLKNMEGRTLMTAQNPDAVDLSSFARGIYLLSITDSQNKLLKVEKVILN